jgi:hypothetical protein
MKTQKQTVIDRLTRTLFSWPLHLAEYGNLPMSKGQAQSATLRMERALFQLGVNGLTKEQIEAVKVLIGTAASTAYSAGFSAGKECK